MLDASLPKIETSGLVVRRSGAPMADRPAISQEARFPEDGVRYCLGRSRLKAYESSATGTEQRSVSTL